MLTEADDSVPERQEVAGEALGGDINGYLLRWKVPLSDVVSELCHIFAQNGARFATLITTNHMKTKGTDKAIEGYQ